MRGAHRGVLCSKIQHLIEAELFAAERCRPAPSGRALLCAANYAREIQGITASQNLPDARSRTPVSPRNRRASRRKGGFGGVKRGKGNHTVPFSPRRRAAALPRHVMANIPGPGRACLACGGKPPERRNRSPSAEGKRKGRFFASSGAPLYRRKGLPPADDKVFKDLQSLL